MLLKLSIRGVFNLKIYPAILQTEMRKRSDIPSMAILPFTTDHALDTLLDHAENFFSGID